MAMPIFNVYQATNRKCNSDRTEMRYSSTHAQLHTVAKTKQMHQNECKDYIIQSHLWISHDHSKRQDCTRIT